MEDEAGAPDVRLSANEMAFFGYYGLMRQAESAVAKRKPSFSYKTVAEPFAVHAISAMCEAATYRFFGYDLKGMKLSVNAFNVPDVCGVQVRGCMTSPPFLKVRGADPDMTPCLLVVPQPPVFWIRGWMLAGKARQHDEWRRDPGGRGCFAWFVPEDYLLPPEQLIAHAHTAVGRTGG